MAGEFDFINWIRSQQAQQRSRAVVLPAGDDMAVLKWPGDELLLVGVDQVIDSVHFDSREHGPRQIGRKVMNRNLSDCAAMACLPVAAVVAVALPQGSSLEYAQELYLGLRDAGDPFDCHIVGGDTASWDGKLVLTVTALGRSAGIQPVTRQGAKPGDGIYVSGPLGGSILGRHMTFSPRIQWARQLAGTGQITAMIDISDGVSRDLGHICQQSNVGAALDADAIPIHPDAVELGRRDGKPAIEHALHDGEDHELLYTTAGAAQAAADAIGSHTRIGTITAGPGIWITQAGHRLPLEPRGWEHAL